MNGCGHRWDAASAGPEVRTLGFGVMALRYAEWGYAVVPCERGGKKPHRMLPPEGGVHWASLEAAQIREWWSIDPYASIGIATGAASALAVIDLDVKNGHDGIGEFSRFLGLTAAMSAYPWARTPSGGVHLWMRIPPGTHVPERPAILAGVDVKGSGGLVIAAPSARFVTGDGHDGERTEPLPVPYEWISGCPCSVPWAPDWLHGWVTTATSTAHEHKDTRPDPVDIAELKKTGIPVGQRNHVMYRVACSMYRLYGTTPRSAELVLEQIRAIWEACDRTGFGWREVMVCAESARKFIEHKQQQERSAFTSYAGHRPELMPPWARGG